jgi:hypothetical protein
MNVTIERVVEATLEVYDLMSEPNDVLGAAYEAHHTGLYLGATQPSFIARAS